MKKLMPILLTLLFASSAFAYDTTWTFTQQNPEWVSGFKAKYGIVKGGPYTTTFDCKKPAPLADKSYSCTVTGVVPKTIYGVVVNYDSAGVESSPSNEFAFTAPTLPPGDLKIVMVITTTSRLTRYGNVIASTTITRKEVPAGTVVKEGTTGYRNSQGQWITRTVIVGS